MPSSLASFDRFWLSGSSVDHSVNPWTTVALRNLWESGFPPCVREGTLRASIGKDLAVTGRTTARICRSVLPGERPYAPFADEVEDRAVSP